VSKTCRVIINQVKQKLHLVGYLLIRYFIFVLNNNLQSIFTGINGSLSINVLTCFGLSKSNISETII